MATTDSTEKIHMGRNVKRFREMLGIKQDALALDLNISQQTVSQIEQKGIIDDGLLEQISKVLKVPAEAIKNFDEEKAVTIISNTFNDQASVFQFNPIEKIIELYERMLKDRNEVIERLEVLLSNKA